MTEEESQMAEKLLTDDGEADSLQEADGEAAPRVFSPSASSAAACTDINGIVDKHLGDFSSEIQLLLQEESTHYNLPHCPHFTSPPAAPKPQPALSYASVSQFSQYVSFYNACPSVQSYVDSLKDSISSVITECDDSWRQHLEPTDAALANRVSAFVASVRAANDTGREDEAADGGSAAPQRPSGGSEAWLPDTANYGNPPNSHVSLPVPPPSSNTSIHCPPSTSPHSQWTPQQSHTGEISRTITQSVSQTQENGTARTVLCTAADRGGNLPAQSIIVTLPGLGGSSDPLGEASHPSESDLSPGSVPGASVGAAPPATALSSLISQLQPDVFNSLVEIIKEVKKNSLQFYIHGTEPGDEVTTDIKVTSGLKARARALRSSQRKSLIGFLCSYQCQRKQL